MTKHEFVEDIAKRCGLSKADAGRAVNAFLEEVTDVLEKRDEVSFTGFGRFSTARRKAREGVNPRDPRQKLKIPARVVPKFKAGTALRQAVAERAEEPRPETVASPAARETEWTPLAERT